MTVVLLTTFSTYIKVFPFVEGHLDVACPLYMAERLHWTSHFPRLMAAGLILLPPSSPCCLGQE